jgi:hypothetical protein
MDVANILIQTCRHELHTHGGVRRQIPRIEFTIKRPRRPAGDCVGFCVIGPLDDVVYCNRHTVWLKEEIRYRGAR